MNAFNEHLSRLLEWIYRVLSSSILRVENINLIEYTRHTYLSKYLSKVYTYYYITNMFGKNHNFTSEI